MAPPHRHTDEDDDGARSARGGGDEGIAENLRACLLKEGEPRPGLGGCSHDQLQAQVGLIQEHPTGGAAQVSIFKHTRVANTFNTANRDVTLDLRLSLAIGDWTCAVRE